MTDGQRELERRLERATARQCPAEDSLEPETAALRAGWLALGELLEAAQPQADPPPRLLSLRPVQRRKRWLPVTMAVTAASVLLAVTVAWSVRGIRPAAIPSPQPSQVADGRIKPSPAAAKQTLPRTAEQMPTASGNAETWDDSLDQEIERAGRAILQAQQDQLASAAASGRFQYQLENLKKDLEDSPL